MANLGSIQDTIDRLEKRWFEEKPLFSEKVIEAALLVELFRGPLGFNEKSAKRSQRKTMEGNSQEIDILLRLSRKVMVVVEVKHPTECLNESQLKRALRQAGRYVRDLGQQYGMVTDGLRWVYFKVEPFSTFHRLYPLLQFHIKETQGLALKALERSKKRTLKEFLDKLAALHCRMTSEEFDRLMNLGLHERLQHLVNKAKAHNLHLGEADRRVIRTLYSGALPTRLISPILKPLNLTKK